MVSMERRKWRKWAFKRPLRKKENVKLFDELIRPFRRISEDRGLYKVFQITAQGRRTSEDGVLHKDLQRFFWEQRTFKGSSKDKGTLQGLLKIDR